MIHAKESGNPRIKGVADEKIEYPGQIKERVSRIATIQKMIRDVRYLEFFLDGSVMRYIRKSVIDSA